MVTEASEILYISDNEAPASVDDDLTVIYATPTSLKKETSKKNPILVEKYQFRAKIYYDLVNDDDDDDVKILASFPRKRKKIYRGESSGQKAAKDAEIVPPTTTTFMCEICVDEKPTKELFHVLGCTHSYCSECMTKFVASKLQENITDINCPVSGCQGFLEPQHCRSILPQQVFDRWGDLLCEKAILGSEKLYCPFKDCSALLIDDTKDIEQSECPNCKRLFCARCKVPWHFGIMCKEFQELTKDETTNEYKKLMELAKTNSWKRCPNCKFYVERSGGCFFMTCRCGYTFCYQCGAHATNHYCANCTGNATAGAIHVDRNVNMILNAPAFRLWHNMQ